VGNVFIESTAVRPSPSGGEREGPAGGGRYEASIDPGWNLRPLPHGGVVTAMAARAMVDHLDAPDQRLRTLHTTFVAQVAHGDVEIDVELLRRSRSVSHVRSEVRNVGQVRGHTTTAVFGSTRRGFDFTDLEPPLPPPRPPDACPSYRDPIPPEVDLENWEPLPFWERVEGRPVIDHPPWVENVAERAVRSVWNRMDDPPFLDDGTLDPLALVVFADMMPGALAEREGNDNSQWFAPSIDLTFHLLDDCRSSWVLAHNTVRHAGDGYASGDMALWDYGENGTDKPRLVAYATQLFLFSFLR